MDQQERKRLQRAAREKQLNEIEQSLNDASKTIEESKRQIARSHELLRERRRQSKRHYYFDVREDSRFPCASAGAAPSARLSNTRCCSR